MNIEINDEKVISTSVVDSMRAAAELCLKHENINPENVEISLFFASEDEIRRINRDYRNIDSVTDVLSFPQFDDLYEIYGSVTVFLGDIVICVDRARAQSEAFGHSNERELVYLFVHSMFHLLGYDHMEETDKKEMRKAEDDIMTLLKIERI